MLISLTLTLTATRSGRLPAFQGRANYAEALRHLNRIHAPSGDLIHGHALDNAPRALTCSSLLGAAQHRGHLVIEKGADYQVRLTGITPAVSAILEQMLAGPAYAEWVLESKRYRFPFEICAVTCDPTRDPWSGLTSYEQLAAFHLLESAAPNPEVEFCFRAPIAFRSKGLHVPIPMPDLLFGSLADRWNRYSSVELPFDMRSVSSGAIAVSKYAMRSVAVAVKSGATVKGGVGSVTYRCMQPDRYYLAAMHMLADFALFSGAGVKTSSGLGQCRRISHREAGARRSAHDHRQRKPHYAQSTLPG